MSRRHIYGIVGSIALAAAASCVREPLDHVCPAIDAGDLVITELRGPQSGADTYGQWIELYNPSDRPIALGGITVYLAKLDGSGDFRFMVRDADAEIAAGGYAVLAGATAADKPFATYEFSSDEDGALYSAAIVRVYSCETMIDTMLYRALPSVGTLALDGAQEPDAAANESTDDPIWCVDAAPPGPGEPMIELGVRGTPGEANPPCP